MELTEFSWVFGELSKLNWVFLNCAELVELSALYWDKLSTCFSISALGRLLRTVL